MAAAEQGPDAVKEEEQVVNPWEVSAGKGGIDYDKLVDQFGCQRLDAALVDRVARLTGRPPHVFLHRGLFFAHRDFSDILDLYEKGEKFYLYRGRGPSSEALHLGHLIPFMFTKYLQEAFKNLTVEESKRLARENAKDIIACGFDVERTFIFADFGYVGGAFYENMAKVARCVTCNKAVGTFGFSPEDHIGKYSFPPVQAVPSFPSSFPHLFAGKDQLRCLIPCAIDQDPYFRMTRDVAPRIHYQKPSLIESRFFPALQVNKYVFSGGQDSVELHRKLGANLDVDVPIKYLNFFLEDDDELEHIKKLLYTRSTRKEGWMLTGEVKQRLIAILSELVARHQRARAQVTNEMVDAFMAVRPLPKMFS
ncbi:tryptophan--tRNA ligase, cytoplasmic [Panicum miliaceum]|uniref:Tryptophan--tRNA ligase, cytoplasmic n=1 Tax=Panicum miliaceum TaxID=4540 RepID=A0A3L6T6K6_PANMI|nr:tryptophan--tRNA ligase, cytoplasmic [Panicum miliaceum]